jgi:four helix bundle protein
MNYQDLLAWQRGMDLVEAIYHAPHAIPADEKYGLTSQMRRAAVSVPANIAEGQGRGGDAELVRFLRIAHGSLRELETHILIAVRLRYLEDSIARTLLDLAGEFGRLINGLIRSKK